MFTAKRYFLVLLFCVVSALSWSQEYSFGVKAGFNYASIVGNRTNGIKFRFSGHGGVFMEARYNAKFSLQPELVYSSQGFQYSTDLDAIESNGPVAGDNDLRTNVQLNYLTLPVLANFALSTGVDLSFGPQFGFLINQVTKTKLLDEPPSTLDIDAKRTVSGNFQLDYGLAAGLNVRMGYQLYMVPRFYIGIRNRLNGLPGTDENYNVALQLSLHYSI